MRDFHAWPGITGLWILHSSFHLLPSSSRGRFAASQAVWRRYGGGPGALRRRYAVARRRLTVSFQDSRLLLASGFDVPRWTFDVRCSPPLQIRLVSSRCRITSCSANGSRIQTALPPGSPAPAGAVVQSGGASGRLAAQAATLGRPHRLRPRRPDQGCSILPIVKRNGK